MEKTLIFGHKNPDTDTISSALAYAHLKNAIGNVTEAVRLGEPNKETDYALEYFEVKAPRLIDTVDDDVTDVILVDHNEFQQSVENIQDVRITEVIDHHRVANFETKEPLYMRFEPVGCTATILKKIYEEKNVEIDKQIAGLLLSAIISDSLLFKSPTCTQEDIDAANELAKIAAVDPNVYGMDMLKAGTDLSDKSARDMLTMDAKPFNMGGQTVEIAQVNTFDLEQVYERQAELEQEMDAMIAEKDLGLVLFVATDILNSNSEVLARGSAKDNVERAFNVTLNNDRAVLEGVVSRKKQIVTNLTDAFK